MITVLLFLLAATPATAQKNPSGGGLSVSGFVSGTLFVQDQLFEPGNGQQAQYVRDREREDAWWHGGDVRNTRLVAEVRRAARLRDWRVGGTVEADFFGGFTAGGDPAGRGQPVPQLRLAYVELQKGATRLRFGQDWSLLHGYAPESVTHLAFPLGFGAAGSVGWRYPGIFLHHEVGGQESSAKLQVAVLQGAWNDEPDAELPSAGQATLVPQVEVRVDLMQDSRRGTDWGLYLAGHFDRKNLSGFGSELPEAYLDGWAVAAGARVQPGPLALQGGFYVGQAIGQHGGHISQFGDITGWGGWGQLGLHFSPRWSLWGFVGLDDPNDEDLGINTRVRNMLVNTMLRYGAGPYAFGLSWLHARTDWAVAGTGQDLAGRTRTGNQIAASMVFYF